jgi:hypothetical protein
MAVSAKDRTKAQRERDAQHLIDVGAKEIKLTAFRSTLEDIEFLKQAGDFEQLEEVLTLLVKNAAEIIKRDMSQLPILLKVPSHGKGTKNV